jgi:cholesterol transport system auxiliary component
MSHLRLPLLILGMALCGCSGLFHSSAPGVQLYVVQPPPAPSVSTADAVAADRAPRSTGATLRIARPLAAAGLNTDRIALLRSGNRLDYYALARWSAPLTDVVSDLLLEEFRADPLWSAVVDERGTLNAGYLLQTSIDRFTADYTPQSSAPTVRVELHCLLLRRSDGVLLGSFAVSRSEPAPENRMASVIAVFSREADEALVAVAAQADQLLRSAKSPAAP